LAYTNDQIKLDYDGFGFLTPHPSSKNTHPVPGTLGVVFDSNAMSGQEKDSPLKLTVMLGGHMWNNTFDKPAREIDPKIVRDRAIQAVERHLGIKATPTYSMTHIQSQCIPQYQVGHYQRLREMHEALQSQYGHSLSVTGASYFGVSVPDCIKNARELVEELTVSGALGSRAKVVTGLNRVEEGNSSERLRDSANISKGHIDVLMKS
jgi:oxygen-dependent protoporphyrinogen oxidase